jgi:hypothetical protein
LSGSEKLLRRTAEDLCETHYGLGRRGWKAAVFQLADIRKIDFGEVGQLPLTDPRLSPPVPQCVAKFGAHVDRILNVEYFVNAFLSMTL